jgi:outer membrane protein OmpA-like peptidoglycan-associated protein
VTPLAPLLLALGLLACGPAKPPDHAVANAPAARDPAAGADRAGADPAEGDLRAFEIRESDTAAEARGVNPSKIKPTKTEAALRLFVIDKDKGPIQGIVIALTAPSGSKYYTEETDAEGYAEALVPVGQTYTLSYLTLGRRDVSAKVTVSDKPNQNLKLTLRYQREDYSGGGPAADRRFVLKGVQFETNKATLTPESFARLDTVVEYMTHKRSARLEISGHTDNVGKPASNKALSQKRANACRDYLVSKGIDPARIEAVGYGADRPIASNDTEEGRAQNRRIEATEL